MTHVLDAGAVLAWMADEPGADLVEQALDGSLLPTVCLTEILRRAQAYGHPSPARTIADDLVGAGLLLVEEITQADAVRAAELRQFSYTARSQWTEEDLRRTRTGKPGTLSTADSLCLAVAERHGLPVLTTDRAWSVVERLIGGFAVKTICIR
ncbi:type II toxin-antitoxin system VapC family toxin [Kitasatospora acidiphila]|uniref:Type II toxin-antitoxin system VapC family toxin n=1 Tax=Kitasatospora acidiphila TaxID=2567942 RepID=A0A540W8H0_9ACTN|nr:PIN domain-containing protein [Kitasatospora acidiphila]TQF04664.1 type II toxin-antitoxin system VapC family toxin [Kitasatospora acidiphila]